MVDPNKMYLIEELSVELGIKPRTLRERASKGDYPSIFFHNRYYFYGRDVILAIRKLGTPKGEPSEWK